MSNLTPEPNNGTSQSDDADPLVRAILMGVSLGDDEPDDVERGPDGIDPAHMFAPPHDPEDDEPDPEDAEWDD